MNENIKKIEELQAVVFFWVNLKTFYYFVGNCGPDWEKRKATIMTFGDFAQSLLKEFENSSFPEDFFVNVLPERFENKFNEILSESSDLNEHDYANYLLELLVR